jgi:thiol-disulfide isomerase/thioredoxin
MKSKHMMYLVGALLLIAIIGYFVNPKSISGFEDAGGARLCMVYANWCPHCSSIKDEMKQLSKDIDAGQEPRLKGKNCKFEMYEEKENADKIAELPPVKGYPTFFYLKGGNVTEYKGGRDRDSIVSYLSTQ